MQFPVPVREKRRDSRGQLAGGREGKKDTDTLELETVSGNH
jgi:hypothetical protein